MPLNKLFVWSGLSDMEFKSSVAHFVSFFASCLVTSSLLIGCGSTPAPKPETEQAAISGSVTVGDKPVPPNCDVIFQNDQEGLTIAAKTDANGKFVLTAADPRFGIPVGRYQVAIKPASSQTAPKMDSKEYEDMMKGIKPAATPEDNLIEKKFYSHAESGIVVEAKKGPNEFNIDLSKY